MKKIEDKTDLSPSDLFGLLATNIILERKLTPAYFMALLRNIPMFKDTHRTTKSDKKTSKYSPKNGEYAGKEGIMVTRFCNTSYDDIKLLFEDGESRWFEWKNVNALPDAL